MPLHTREIRRGLAFQSLKARHCWLDRESPVLLADYVTADAGTGLVHTAPDHGVDDFNLAHHLGLLQLVGPDGRYTPAVNDPELEGRNIFDCNPLVVDRLRASARCCTRRSWCTATRTAGAPRPRSSSGPPSSGSSPWTTSSTARARPCANWAWRAWTAPSGCPAQGRNRIYAMIAGRPDWCISRQRAWGSPITVLRCSECGEPLVRAEIFEKAAAGHRRRRGGGLGRAAAGAAQARPTPSAPSAPGASSRRRPTSWTSGSIPG